jgi:predicted dienelactone hydrolase
MHGVTLDPVRWDPLSYEDPSDVAREGVAIDAGGPAFPVVIFSHGSGNSPIEYVLALEHLASHGYIVAAPWHTGNHQDDNLAGFANRQAGWPALPQIVQCIDGLPMPCVDSVARAVMSDRVNDIRVILDTLPTLFGSRVDMSQVGVMGHSRGSQTALLAAGGSTAAWGIAPEPRIKAILVQAIIGASEFPNFNFPGVTVPALLMAAEFDVTTPAALSVQAYNNIASTEKAYVLVNNAVHRSFDSAMCDQMQAAGAVTQANPVRALLDRNVVTGLLTNSASTLDYCTFDKFTTPVDIRPIVQSITGFSVTPTNVPRRGVSSDEVAALTGELAVIFFNATLDNKRHYHFKHYLDAKFMAKYDAYIEQVERVEEPKPNNGLIENDD